jgi:hypothetical protein
VAFGELTKHLAEQAITGAVRGKPETPPPAPQAEDVCAIVVGQIQGMQKALKEDDELVIHLHAGQEKIRVLEIFVPSRSVLVFTGHDAENRMTRVVTPVDAAQLVCKVEKVAPPAKPARINFLKPKS